MIHLHDAEEYELSQTAADWLDDDDLPSSAHVQTRLLGRPRRRPLRLVSSLARLFTRPSWKRPHPRHACWIWSKYTLIALVLWILIVFLFMPSYGSPPSAYSTLKAESTGHLNARNVRVFLAASLYDPDGRLLGGQWAENVHNLVSLLGPENVFVSVYENEGPAALDTFRDRLACRHSVVNDAAVVMPRVSLPDGSQRVRRIAYLAETRNRAMRPFEQNGPFDRVVFLNDVYFDPMQAVQLILLTNADATGQARYQAACAMDFINPIKFYDTFATRDVEGYSMGLPLYPWFSGAGSAQSRAAVFRQSDSVPVKSCWGGLVSFDARRFAGPQAVQFRASDEPFWEASECCLIHADLGPGGHFVNPFVRVAYDPATLAWIPFFQRFERLWSPLQRIVNRIVGLPWHNARRTQAWVSPNATADDGFCGIPGMQLLSEDGHGWHSLSPPHARP